MVLVVVVALLIVAAILLAAMNGVHPNAVAGPSRSSSPLVSSVLAPPSSSPHPAAAIPLFLPPPGQSVVQIKFCWIFSDPFYSTVGPPQPKQHLVSTQDLLSRFNLVSAYDRYVRPFVIPGNEDAGEQPLTPGGVDKGKGRELPPNTSPVQGREQSPPGGDGDDEDGTGRGDKKKKNNYKHLIKGIYGASFVGGAMLQLFFFSLLSFYHHRQALDEKR